MFYFHCGVSFSLFSLWENKSIKLVNTCVRDCSDSFVVIFSVFILSMPSLSTLPLKEELRRVREQTTENNLLCLVTTYNPNNPQVFQLVRKTLPMLNQNSSLKSIMSKTKVIHSHRQPRNLKRMLTNSYFSSQKDTDPEVKICGTKRCGTCPYLK